MRDTGPLYGHATIAALYRSAFKAFADREALVGQDIRLTYGELEARSHQIARYFLSIGLRRQDGIAMLAGNRVDAMAAIIAAQLLGLRYTALHPLGSADDQAFVLRDAGIRALVIDTPRHGERGAALASLGIVEHVLTLGPAAFGVDLAAASAGMDASDIPLDVQPGDIFKIAYTGGTTGKSKGVVQPHRTAVTMILQQLACWEWPDDARFLATTPISHAAGALILPTFLRGGTVVFLDKYDPLAFLEAVARHSITCTFLVPSQIYGLLDFPGLADHDLSSLHRIWYGAAPIAPARLAEAIGRIGRIFGQIYGQAEAPMTVTYLRADEHDPARPHLMGSCGRPIPGNDVRLLDTQLQEVPPGEIGELCVRGPLVMSGYLNRPEETAKTLAGDWLHTGDMARRDAAGYLYLVDRAKDMIISGGFNVYSSEVENCLAAHPAVAMSAVIGVPHAKWGEAVTALVVLKPDASVTEQALIDYVTERKGVVCAPKSVSFETELPHTSLGKLDKKTLRARYWSGQDRQVS
ncbi:AMP-binding protein [Cupriavidus sp. RAF20_2]|jgi:fatty-acyl-CoA synthase|uniref:AMP-binding protein n=1 Tax=Cupriavidus sp. RAF20_2 TaxID=3233053 RepID=UPI003F8EC8A1